MVVAIADFTHLSLPSQLPLPLYLCHLRDHVTDLVAVEFGNGRDTMDVADQVCGLAQERFERCLAVAATKQMTAITDLILALQPVAAIVLIKIFHVRRPMWTDVWRLFFCLLCLANLLGVAAHAAAIIDTQTSIQVTMIWKFNNHGVFHIVQMLSLLLITVGIQMSHRTVSAVDA